MERKIGEVFKYRGVMLKVVEGKGCNGCYFTQICKRTEITLHLDTRIKESYFSVNRERYRHCNLDDNALEIAGQCARFYREDYVNVSFKKVE